MRLSETEPQMDDFQALTCELASMILQHEAESGGSQPQTSVRIAQLILNEVQPDGLALSVAGSSRKLSLQ